MKVLVTGGVRSGKSRHAESLLSGQERVRYVAPGPVLDDADWAARIEAHRARRPATWTTVETHDLPAALAEVATDEAVLVDCLGTWLTASVDAAGLWDAPSARLTTWVEERADEVVAALPTSIVLVTNEVGLGIVPEHRSGRVFRDLLGTVNLRVAEVCQEVHLVVAGRVLHL